MSLYRHELSAEDAALAHDREYCCISGCDQEAHTAATLPVCQRHSTVIARDVERERRADPAFTEPRVTLEQYLQRVHHPTREDAAHVYYLELPSGNIKIGYSTNIPARIRDLRLDPHVLLAKEVGGPKLERARHIEFADLRVGRREDFAPGDELLDHIRHLQSVSLARDDSSV